MKWEAFRQMPGRSPSVTRRRDLEAENGALRDRLDKLDSECARLGRRAEKAEANAAAWHRVAADARAMVADLEWQDHQRIRAEHARTVHDDRTRDVRIFGNT